MGLSKVPFYPSRSVQPQTKEQSIGDVNVLDVQVSVKQGCMQVFQGRI